MYDRYDRYPFDAIEPTTYEAKHMPQGYKLEGKYVCSKWLFLLDLGYCTMLLYLVLSLYLASDF